jgi:hypothetical protein
MDDGQQIMRQIIGGDSTVVAVRPMDEPSNAQDIDFAFEVPILKQFILARQPGHRTALNSPDDREDGPAGRAHRSQYIDNNAAVWEKESLERLTKDGEFIAYRRDGFRRPTDTLRELRLLEDLWQKGTASWRMA